MDSEGIVGAGAQFGAVEDVEDVVATMGNGTVAGADGVQARGAGELGDAQDVQVVGHSDSMGLEGIAGAGAQLGAADKDGGSDGGWADWRRKLEQKWHKWNGLSSLLRVTLVFPLTDFALANQ